MTPFFDAVLFDFDGTLADTQQDVWLSLFYGAEKLGGNFPEEFCTNPANLSLSMEEIFAMLRLPKEPGQLEKFKELVNTHYQSLNHYPATQLYQGMEQLLCQLKASGVFMGIATMKSYAATTRILQKKGWADFFTCWYSPDGPGNWQYDKVQMVGQILKDYPVNGSAIMVGDSPGDIKAARLNGIPSVGILYGDSPAESITAALPTYLARNTKELGEYLLQSR